MPLWLTNSSNIEKLNPFHGCGIQHPSQNQHSCFMMDNNDAWMYFHDEVVEQLDLNSVLKATESPKVYASLLVISKVNHGKSTFQSCQKCHGPVFTSLFKNFMLSTVTIFTAIFYTLYTTDHLGSNGRISVRKDENQWTLT